MTRRQDRETYIADNRRARHGYDILEEIEVGIVLTGTEVKSLRLGQVQLADAYAGARQGELVLLNLHIAAYPHAGRVFQHDPARPRVLLVQRKQRARLLARVQKERLTLVPLRLYFNRRGVAKLLLGLARGRRLVDKRAHIKDRDWQRRKQQRILD